MYEFLIKRNSFEPAEATLVVEGRIINEDKNPPLIINPLNLDQGAGVQAGRCAECGSAGCFQGANADHIGCPFGRDIPDIHQDLAAAGKVEKRAIEALRKAAPEELARLQDDLGRKNESSVSGLPNANTQFPKRVFEALRKIDPQKADSEERLFNSYMKSAFKRSSQKGPMGDIYSRICPGTLCEKTCTTNASGHGAVTIKMNEAAVWDYAWESGWLTPIKPRMERPETILIVGSGFAGFAAAERAREMGYKVVVADKNSEPGEPGNNQILTYKTTMGRFRRHWDRLRESGVEVMCGTRIGEDMPLKELSDSLKAKAVILATGATKPKDAKLYGEEKDAVIAWNLSTGEQQRVDRESLSGADIPSSFNAAGKKIVIIGTGDTAVDCARVAIVQGAREIVMVSRHDKVKAEDEDRIAYQTMLDRAKQAGIDFHIQHWMHPMGVKCAPGGGYILSGPNKNPDGQDEMITIQGDMIVSAVGNETGPLREIYGIANLPVSNSGSLVVTPVPERIADKTHLMNVGAGLCGKLGDVYIFAAGQCVREAGQNSLAATNGRDGIDAARWVDEALQDPDRFEREIEETGQPILVLDA